MSRLLTTNPIALRFLMNEAIFHLAGEDKVVDSISVVDAPLEIVNTPLEDAIPVFPFWGSNEKKVLFLVLNAGFDYFSPDAEDAFLKTLSALQLTIQDVVVVNLDKIGDSVDDIMKVLKPAVCIYCGDEKMLKGEVFNELFEKEGVTTLYTYSFESMLTDNNKKRTFWNAIKVINVV